MAGPGGVPASAARCRHHHDQRAIAVTSIDGLHYAQDLALDGMDLAEERRRQPHAGSLFRHRPGMTELPPFAH
jgi:hypothetical protein